MLRLWRICPQQDQHGCSRVYAFLELHICPKDANPYQATLSWGHELYGAASLPIPRPCVPGAAWAVDLAARDTETTNRSEPPAQAS